MAIFLSVIMSVVLLGCQKGESSTDDKISVVTSFYPMYEFAQQVAGDRANVSLMVSDGQDAHHYEPSAKDVAQVNKADVFVYSSEEMEYWVNSLLKTIDNDNLIIARTADGLELEDTNETGHSHEHDHGDSEGEENHESTENITIQGKADHYHTGDMIELTAKLDEEVDYDHWHWYTRESADKEWVTVPNQGGSKFQYEAAGESFEVRAVLFDEEHNEFAVAAPVEIIINNHGHDHGEEASHEHANGEEEHDHESDGSVKKVEIVGLADHYHTGDVVSLVAQLKEEADYDHWHWYTRGSEEEDWEVVSGQGSDHFEYKTTGESFELKAALFDEEHHTFAESEPVTVFINDHNNHDPHIWLDPVLAQEQVKIIRDAFIKADPDGKDIYEKNTEAFIKELQALDKEYETTLKDAKNRVFVVQHQAFGYLAKRYNIEQIAIGGLSTEVEPSPSRMAEIGTLVKDHNVPVIYYQHGANSAIAKTVANETGTKTAILYDLEVLSKELKEKDLGYLDAMRENLKALQLSVK